MRVNLDQIAGPEQLLPWELVLTIDGADHPTVRPTVGTIVALESGTKAGQFQAVRSIFRDPPDLSAWTGERIAAAIAAYLVAFGEQVRKNSPALVAAVRQQLATPTTGATPGTSS